MIWVCRQCDQSCVTPWPFPPHPSALRLTVARHLLLLLVLVALLRLSILAQSQPPQRADGPGRRAPQQGQRLRPEACAQAQIEKRPEACVNVAQQKRHFQWGFQGMTHFPRPASDGVHNERDIVGCPAQEEDYHQPKHHREGPSLVWLFGASLGSQGHATAADDQDGGRQQEPQRVVKHARRQMPDAGRRGKVLHAQHFLAAWVIQSHHENPYGNNKDERADPDAQAGPMSEAGSALWVDSGGARVEEVAIQNDANQQKDPAVEADLRNGKQRLYKVTFAFSSSKKGCNHTRSDSGWPNLHWKAPCWSCTELAPAQSTTHKAGTPAQPRAAASTGAGRLRGTGGGKRCPWCSRSAASGTGRSGEADSPAGPPPARPGAGLGSTQQYRPQAQTHPCSHSRNLGCRFP